MTELKHKTPCNECPWRRSHVPGWLGGYSIDTFLNQVQFDGPPIPCHKTLEDGSTGEAMCAGALIFMKNSAKSPQHPAYGDALDHVKKNTDDIFRWPHEFREHHETPLEDWNPE